MITTFALVAAAAIAYIGLVFRSVGTVVVALTALGAISGAWITGRHRS